MANKPRDLLRGVEVRIREPTKGLPYLMTIKTSFCISQLTRTTYV
ncbi:hypothetical protein ES703_24654 [subsurface metagenome]